MQSSQKTYGYIGKLFKSNRFLISGIQVPNSLHSSLKNLLRIVHNHLDLRIALLYQILHLLMGALQVIRIDCLGYLHGPQFLLLLPPGFTNGM